jgi:fatty acid desaturase
VKRWSIYAGLSATLVATASAIGFMFEPPARGGIWLGLGSAWAVQALAFGVLIAVTSRRAQHVMAGWTVGTFLRLAALALLAWLTLGGVVDLPAAPTLMSLIAALFVLLLLEPVVFRYRIEAR